jgi:RNA polymerase sigma factor (sigma-70 family)
MTRPQQMTDDELVKGYRQGGDLALLGELFIRYRSLLYGTCLKYLKDRDEAQDMVMQLFEKLTQTLREHAVDHPRSWLYVTARNQCLMWLRAQKGRFSQNIDEAPVENELLLHPAGEENQEENLVKLEKCIEQLAAEQQVCVRQFYLQEQCYRNIASATGFTLNQVKSYIQNGKRNLKICMDQHE